ncbi:MAG: hypothetical protein ACLUVZ_15950 [Bacteroides stercoris]
MEIARVVHRFEYTCCRVNACGCNTGCVDGCTAQTTPVDAIFIACTPATAPPRTKITVNSLLLDTPAIPSFGTMMMASPSMLPITFILAPIGNVEELVNEWNSVGASFTEAVR